MELTCFITAVLKLVEICWLYLYPVSWTSFENSVASVPPLRARDISAIDIFLTIEFHEQMVKIESRLHDSRNRILVLAPLYAHAASTISG